MNWTRGPAVCQNGFTAAQARHSFTSEGLPCETLLGDGFLYARGSRSGIVRCGAFALRDSWNRADRAQGAEKQTAGSRRSCESGRLCRALDRRLHREPPGEDRPRELMSRSPWLMLSLVMPAALGAVTVAGVMALSDAPARTIEPSLRSTEAVESKREAQSGQGQGESRVAPGGNRSAQPPAPASEKSQPTSKPRLNKPADGSGRVMLA